MLLSSRCELYKLLSQLIDEAECKGQLSECASIEDCKYRYDDNTCTIQNLIERV